MRKEILRTIIYADIFDYPLCLQEVWHYLISPKQFNQQKIKEGIKKIPNIETERGYFFLKNRRRTIAIREKRKKISEEKLKTAHRAARILKMIPTIKLIALTGSLAMNNAKKADDIDFLIIAASNRLWLTRGLVVVLLRLMGLYRRPDKINNMICPNMFLAEDNLEIPSKEQDLFSAHEVVQVKPLWFKDNMYNRFLKENLWSQKYLANWKN